MGPPADGEQDQDECRALDPVSPGGWPDQYVSLLSNHLRGVGGDYGSDTGHRLSRLEVKGQPAAHIYM